MQRVVYLKIKTISHVNLLLSVAKRMLLFLSPPPLWLCSVCICFDMQEGKEPVTALVDGRYAPP